MTDTLNTKKDKLIDSKGTKRPLTSLLWGDVPSEMSQRYSWKGQQAHKVKPTLSCYSQHQRQVQHRSCSLWAGMKTAALIPPTARPPSCEDDRGQLDVQILINWFNCSKLLNLNAIFGGQWGCCPLDLSCVWWTGNAKKINIRPLVSTDAFFFPESKLNISG